MSRHSIFNITTALLLTMAAASCSEDIVGGSAQHNNALAFTASQAWPVETAGTRAIGDKTAFVSGDAISMTATYVATGGDISAAAPEFMYDQKVDYDGSTWTYSPTRYWPADGTLHFFAHYPRQNAAVTMSAQTDKGTPTLSFQQPEAADVDLLTAYSAQDCAARTTNSVAMAMRHSLAKLNFLFSNSTAATISVKKITFAVPQSGTFAYAYDDNGVPQWTTNGTLTLTRQLTDAVDITAGESSKSIDAFTSLILPTAITAFTITYGDGTEKTCTPSDAIDIVAGKEYNLCINASDGGTDVKVFTKDANCYILNPPTSGTKTFEIPIKRIDVFWGNNGYEDVADNTLGVSNPWTADILWSEYANTDTAKLTTVSGTGNAAGFQVTVPAGASGNAIVAVRNASGTILWSWHLWITDYDPDAKLKEGFTVMDRNLGALTEAYDDNGGIGRLYYQYGRKDPFRYTKSLKKDNLYPTTSAVETVSGQKGTDMAFAVNNPTVFITKKAGSTYKEDGWWTVGNDYNPYPVDTLVWQDPNIKYGQGKKSLFDPSPAGWKVPEGSVFTENMKDPVWNDDGTMLKYRVSTSEYTSYVYFPAYSSIGELSGRYSNPKTPEGNYWSSWITKDKIEDRKDGNYFKARFLNLENPLGEISETNSRARGMTVRCMYDSSSR